MELSEALNKNNSGEEIKNRSRTLRRKRSDTKTDFFKLAAQIANPDAENIVLANNQTIFYDSHSEMNVSRFLESSYQEKSPLMTASILRCEDIPKLSVDIDEKNFSRYLNCARNKKMPALDFHNWLLSEIKRNDPEPILIIGEKAKHEAIFLADQFRLFWSHRMHLKSLQVAFGAKPSIRYFHAIFRASRRPDDRISVLYWLKLTADNEPEHGEYIDAPDCIVPKIAQSYLGLFEELASSKRFLKYDETFKHAVETYFWKRL